MTMDIGFVKLAGRWFAECGCVCYGLELKNVVEGYRDGVS